MQKIAKKQSIRHMCNIVYTMYLLIDYIVSIDYLIVIPHKSGRVLGYSHPTIRGA